MRTGLIERFLAKRGLKVAPADHAPSDTALAPSPETAFPAFLNRLKARQFTIQSIVDVGASDGRWSECMLPLFPDSRCLCIEARREHEPALREFVNRHPQAEYVITAAGDREGDIYFDTTDLFGGLASETGAVADCVKVPVTTIDNLVEAHGLLPPYLIKLDTHGYELPILAGATRTLEQTEVLVVEVYNFVIAPTAVRFADFCCLMAEKGFLCLDLFDPMYRPSDGAIWQMDLMFARSSRPEFQNQRYT